MDFCYALKALKEGLRVTRTGWYGEEMWITICIPPVIFMKTVRNDLVPWQASQTDILAVDWQIVSQKVESFLPDSEKPDSQDVSFVQDSAQDSAKDSAQDSAFAQENQE